MREIEYSFETKGFRLIGLMAAAKNTLDRQEKQEAAENKQGRDKKQLTKEITISQCYQPECLCYLESKYGR